MGNAPNDSNGFNVVVYPLARDPTYPLSCCYPTGLNAQNGPMEPA